MENINLKVLSFSKNSQKIINGTEISENLKLQVKNEILSLKNKINRSPKLVVILVGENPASKVYVGNKQKTSLEIGIQSEIIKLDENTNQNELINIIKKLNVDANVDGILVQLPLPKQICELEILKTINPLKDVDCFHPENVGLMLIGKPRFLPCTPAGIIEMLKQKNITLEGKNVVVIGRSNIVGKPLALLLLQNNATVTICHSKTKNLEKLTQKADILIVAIGKANFLTKDMIKKNSIIIDVGINRIDNKLYGDVNFKDVFEKASFITPVPGGVGKMTIIMLMKNTVSAYKIHNKII
ncbi:MAG: bifunctional methylenetetrahydrofolate dehydrogenase/methenyltetrahydrofolate cyclohydrolase FolD [Elusimicrobiota bacterium]|jgi:methylenetetrahydrofolate dehydrogenase (NADP+)/methenyltetrahydrofolate cyclohydrolase|nr:bifunctional methylenetetrahydrofolate dehydrogenase/methenyltetrahydrofolate cyclohydrolase FolD [Elusimicrobiota bacterium]